ncbi:MULTISPECIES: hypothetical protein [Streptomyces]|uniref:Cobyrinic acid a,c-diamide synthase n=2 Tax=Streptomyces TaxID=1883 RepID=A0ABT9KR92_9ACTN|nr:MULTISPECIES: hypothetical protein [Streptomyces]MBW8093146.1 hypothetical protein [Streptomyces hygroscopicus subsp. hygroscopicus]MCO8306147.1 hypothetical protein [Streptomyces sp. RKCA744]MDP9610953.1 hypothetical protein [Streptomyces demainii]
MSRRVSLPGADELFRTTGGMALQSSSPASGRRQANGEGPRVPPPAADPDAGAEPREGQERPDGEQSGPGEHTGRETAASPDAGGERRAAAGDRPKGRQAPGGSATAEQSAPARRRARTANRRPSGRERHDEKITVYVSAEELMDLEHARLVLRGEHGLAVDRGRIVREAVAVVLADLESRGDASILVRRLRGR